MSERPKRQMMHAGVTRRSGWYQIHLTTMIVISVCAGIMLWMNFGFRNFGPIGWPFHFFSYDWTYFDGCIGGYHFSPTRNDTFSVLVDVSIAIGILVCIASACETRLKDRTLDPATRLMEMLCVAACVFGNLADPLGHYVEFRSEIIPAVIHCALSWLIITFLCAFATEAYGRKRRVSLGEARCH